MDRPPPIPGHQRYSTFHRSADDEPARRAWHHAYADVLAPCRAVADAGCGTGVFLDLLAERGVGERLGIDRDPEMVAATRARGHDAVRGDAAAVLREHAGRFDGIHLGFVLETLPGDGAIALVEAAAAALQPDGVLVARTLNWSNEIVARGAFWFEPWNVRPYPLETLHVMLGDAGLRVVAAGHEPEGWQNLYVIARTPSRVAVAPASRTRPSVVVEGEFFAFNSMAQVNRELTLALVRDDRWTIAVKPDEVREDPTVVADERLTPLRARVVRGLPPCDVLVRQHCGEPDLSRPAGPAAVVQIFPWEYGALAQSWVRAFEANVDEIWTPSTYCRQLFLDAGIAPERVAVVPNGIDPGLFRPDAGPPYPVPSAKSFRFLYVGGTIHRKGLDVLLDAYGRAFTAADDVTLIVKDFGTTSFYVRTNQGDAVRAFRERPDAPELVYLTDEMPAQDLVRLYGSAHAFAFPYRGEGFGLPMLEALACGVPVIATAGGAADDFLDETVAYRIPAQRRSLGRTYAGLALCADGWLLEPDRDALAATLRHVVAHPAEAAAKGRAGSERARTAWTWDLAGAVAARRLGALAERLARRA